jgi:hypothetical protein
MICYFPFTYITDPGVAALVECLGPVTIYLPDGGMVSVKMEQWMRHGDLSVHTPKDLDPTALKAAVRSFREWAGIHGTRLSDISDFYRLFQGRPPLVDENAPSQIRTQIRQADNGDAKTEPDRLFQSALYMALAHEHDLHRDEIQRQMGSVTAMEARLYADLSGNTEESDLAPAMAQQPDAGTIDYEPGSHLGARRLQAWACLAREDPAPACAYITTSAAIFDHVLELFPDSRELVCWNLSDLDRTPKLKKRRREALSAAGRAREPWKVRIDGSRNGPKDAVRLTLHCLSGVTPDRLIRRLAKAKSKRFADDTWLNSIIGLVES